MLNNQEKNKYSVIEKLENGKITRKEASNELKISLRQVDRLRIKYHKYGEAGFVHQNKGKIPANKFNEDFIEEIENLYLEKHYDFNFEHFLVTMSIVNMIYLMILC